MILYRSILFLCLIIFVSVSCKNSGNKNQSNESAEDNEEAVTVEQNLLIFHGDAIMRDLIVDIGKSFRHENRDYEVQVHASHSNEAIEILDKGDCDIAFVSTPCQLFNSDEYVCVPFARDMLVVIVNFNNAYLQTLAMQGISRDKLSGILSGKVLSWNDINHRFEDGLPLKAYIPPKTSGTIEYLASFADIKPQEIRVDDVMKEEDVIHNVSNIDVSIGISSHTLAYDKNTQVRRSGLYIVGVDYNNNGFLDNQELIYDDLNELSIAVRNNLTPPELVRTFSLVYKKDNPKKRTIDLYVSFFKEYLPSFLKKYGFISVN
jgi:ABC-type phosphate transport system substrate-binding protein